MFPQNSLTTIQTMTNKQKVLPLFTVDAFTSRPFSGNAAAVCLLPVNYDISDDIKQKIAAEMNISETAYVKLLAEGDTFQTGKQFGLRWFTPACEVPLCGHATLAVAAVLFFECKNDTQVLEFKTISGLLKAKRLPNNKIQIDLPAQEANSVVGEFDKLIKAIVGKLPVHDVVLTKSKQLLIQLSDEVTRKELEDITVNGEELLAASSNVRGAIVTLKASQKDDCIDASGNKYDFFSRYFAPWAGVTEDPVCGSAHTVLAPHWAKILHKQDFYAHQCSFRGGDLNVEIQKDRVLISGNAVVVLRGQITY